MEEGSTTSIPILCRQLSSILAKSHLQTFCFLNFLMPNDAQRSVPCPRAFPTQNRTKHVCSPAVIKLWGQQARSYRHNPCSPREKCPLNFLPTSNQPCSSLLTRRYSSLPKIFMMPAPREVLLLLPREQGAALCVLSLRSLEQHLC